MHASINSRRRPLTGLALATLLLVTRASLAAGADTVGICDMEQLPAAVVEMREAMLEAVAKADIEAMRIPVEMNEIPPAIGPAGADDPIKYWRDASGDGEGREVLAQIGLIMAMPCAKVASTDGQVMLIWPYLAAVPLGSLDPVQLVDFYRLARGEEAKAMRAGGTYTSWRIGIGENGVWHFMETGPVAVP